ncbi:MAG TPA: rhodanese-like domain-containing protein [Thermohalobaculum sp.]|nr:rhodanese-like domain-containing protein [Thermohalobaculum sp.]
MTSIMDRVKAAKQVVPAIAPDEVKEMLGRDDVLVVDVRDGTEVAQSGKVPGAVNVSRGMIEFKADPVSPYYDGETFSKDKTIVLYCASGGRSALSGEALAELGYRDVRNMGSFKDWVEAGGEVEG